MFIRHGQYGTTFNEARALQYFDESMNWRKKNNIYGNTSLQIIQIYGKQVVFF
jgi:hypothetical protein